MELKPFFFCQWIVYLVYFNIVRIADRFYNLFMNGTCLFFLSSSFVGRDVRTWRYKAKWQKRLMFKSFGNHLFRVLRKRFPFSIKLSKEYSLNGFLSNCKGFSVIPIFIFELRLYLRRNKVIKITLFLFYKNNFRRTKALLLARN